MILYCATDLIWATRIKRTAEALGLQARPARSFEQLRDRIADARAAALIVDLTTGQQGLDLIRRAREAEAAPEATPGASESAPRLRILAFGPHVERALLQQGRDAGADEVLPRGAFDRQLPDILVALAGRTGTSG